MLFVKYFFSLIIIFTPLNLKADEVNDWLNKEINTIISAYQNNNLTNENKNLKEAITSKPEDLEEVKEDNEVELNEKNIEADKVEN